MIHTYAGMSVDEAMLQMRKLTRKPARFIYDVLKSARANAVIGKGLDPGRLVVKHLIINKQAYTRGLVYHAKGRAGRRQKPYSRLIATIYEQPIEEIRRTGRIGNYGKQFVVPVLTGTYVDPFRRVDSELATELNQSIQEEQERNSSEKKLSDNTGAEGKKEIV